MQSLLENQEPVFEQAYPTHDPGSDSTITWNLPLGVLANVITVELVGKNKEQTQGSGYYACVDTLDCKGITLDACASDEGS